MSLKTIKINPIFLSSSGGKGTSSTNYLQHNKTRKEKPIGVSLGQSNNIKKKLIARIKNFQQKEQQHQSIQTNKIQDVKEKDTTTSFGDSLNFLDNLARDKDEKKRERKNTSLKKKQITSTTTNAYINIATELPPELDWNTIAPVQQISQTPLTTPQWTAPPQPSYGNLKKGIKPTYRTWMRTTQKQKPLTKPTINILEDINNSINPLPKIVFDSVVDNFMPAPVAALVQPPVAAAPVAALVQPPVAAAPVAALVQPPVAAAAAPYTPSLKPKRKHITRTLKYKLGKHTNGTVSVLIKNSQTRRKIQTEQAALKQKNILDIKNHLRKNNLLKVGSNAPNDVLRQLYEQSILAGQIENKAKDILIHNYFNEEK